MRVFQNSTLYPSYRRRLDSLAETAKSFDARLTSFLYDRFGALHFLKPVLERAPEAFFTNGGDVILQAMWASEHGMPSKSSLQEILIAQIEHHRTEVFYNLDPIKYGSLFVRKLPGSVKKTLCWRAAPSGNVDLSAYGLVLGNFPSILETWRQKGCRAAYFFPALDPEMSQYGLGDRPIDVLFLGTYSRHHTRRAQILEQVAGLAANFQIIYGLDDSRVTKLADSPFGLFPPLRKYRRPRAISNIAKPPVFGRSLYELIGKSKIVLNGAIDMAGQDRGNMRCFEAMGCGALLVSDAGLYPEGMVPDSTILVYKSAEHAKEVITAALSDMTGSAEVARNGRQEVEARYTKQVQWELFCELASNL
jgi:glycosyl transferase family 1